MKFGLRYLLPLFFVFVSLNTLVLLNKQFELKRGIDADILIVANLFFFILHLLVFLFQKNALKHSNPNVFIRSVLGGMMFKMFMCAIAVLAYVTIIGPEYNKPAVFISLIFYLFYLAAEVMMLLRLNRAKNA